MPKRYEAMRDKFIKQGLDTASAKEKAAKIYNGTLRKGEKAVGGHEAKESKSKERKEHK